MASRTGTPHMLLALVLAALIGSRALAGLGVIAKELWFGAPPELRVQRWTHALTSDQAERFELGWSVGESKRSLKPGRTAALFERLEALPDDALLVIVGPKSESSSTFLNHLRPALFPKRVQVVGQVVDPRDSDPLTFLVTQTPEHARIAATWFETLDARDDWTLWRLREEAR